MQQSGGIPFPAWTTAKGQTAQNKSVPHSVQMHDSDQTPGPQKIAIQAGCPFPHSKHENHGDNDMTVFEGVWTAGLALS